jgi:kynurenine formamidase
MNCLIDSLDNSASTFFGTHRILLRAGVCSTENIGPAIDLLPIKGVRLMVMPMKIEGGRGAPARVVAVLSLI